MTDDAELLHRFAVDHAEDAFAELVRRHLTLVYFAALRRTNGDTHLAEDVSLQVFVSLARQARGLRPGTCLPGWLYVATRHAAANAMRTERRRKHREQEAHAMHELSTPSPEDCGWERMKPELDSVLDQLKEADRNAVLLRFFQHRAYAEIGAVLHVSEDAARVRVNRALEKMRTLLAKRGITSTAAALAAALAQPPAAAMPAALATTVTATALSGIATVGLGTASTFSLWTIMSTTKAITGIAGAVTLLALGLAVHEARQAGQARQASIVAAAERDALRSQMARRGNRIHETGEADGAPDRTVAAGDDPSRISRRAVGTSASPAGSTMDLLLSDPVYQELSVRQYRAGLPLTHGPFYRKRGLSPEQVAEFERILTEQHQAMTDAMAAARSQGFSLSDPALKAVPISDVSTPKLRELLGEAGFDEYRAYSQSLKSRRALDPLVVSLYHTDTPLTLEQADRLTALMAQNTPKTPVSGMMSLAASPDWDTLIGQAEKVLSSPQLGQLRALAEKARIDRECNNRQQQLVAQATSVHATTSEPLPRK